MEVIPGYKQTEVGVIPEEWGVEPLERITDPKRTICYGIVQVGQFFNSGITVLAIKNLNGDYATNIHRCSPEIEKPYVRSRVRPGDVLVSVKGTIGRIGLVPHHFSGNISRDLARISFTDSDVPEFWYQLLQSDMAQRRLEATTVGTTRLELSIGPLKQVRMPRPPKPEQRAIAEALSHADALLGGLDRLIAKKRDLKQAAVQQLLTGKIRLPGFDGMWKLTRLKCFATSDRFAIVDGPFGSQLKVDEYVGAGVPVIEMEHLSDSVISESIERFVTARKFEDLKRSAVYPGDIIISKTGSLGKLGLIPDSIDRGLITSRLAKITLDPSRAYRLFVVQYLLKLRSERYWEKVSQGGTMQILGIRMLQDAPIPDISVSEQTAIADVLSDMDAELAALEQRREKTGDLKQAMMQELLTGKIRLV